MYVDWIVNQFLRNNIDGSNLDSVKKYLSIFNRELTSRRLQADINKIDYNGLLKLINDRFGDVSSGDKSGPSGSFAKDLSEYGGTFLGSYKDNDGNLYELAKISADDNVEELFSDSGWCVRHKETAKHHGGPFYLVRKNGKNYLLGGKQYPLNDVNDYDAKEGDINIFANLVDRSTNITPEEIASNNLYTSPEYARTHINELLSGDNKSDYAVRLLVRESITRKDGDIFNKVCNIIDEIKDPKLACALISKGTITREKDKALFEKAVDSALTDSRSISTLLKDRIITINDIENVVRDPEMAVDLLRERVITREKDKALFEKAVDSALTRIGTINELLISGIITPKDVKFYQKAVKMGSGINNPWVAVAFLSKGTITRNDRDLFQKAVSSALTDPTCSSRVLQAGVITRADGDIFWKLVDSATGEPSNGAYPLIAEEIITRADGDFFWKLIRSSALTDAWSAYALLKSGKITRDDGDIFWKAAGVALSVRGYGSALQENGILTPEENNVDFVRRKINELNNTSDQIGNQDSNDTQQDEQQDAIQEGQGNENTEVPVTATYIPKFTKRAKIDYVNFNSKTIDKDIADTGTKPVKDQHGATPDQIGRMQDLQETTYPVFDPQDQEPGIISDRTGDTFYMASFDPIYTNPTAPTPANQEFTDSVNKDIDEVKQNISDEIVFDAQNNWYQGEGVSDQPVKGFSFDFKGKGITQEPLGGENGPVAPQRSKQVWPYAIGDRNSTPVPLAGVSMTDGAIAAEDADLEAEADGASHGNLKNNVKNTVTKNNQPLSGGSFGGTRSARGSANGIFIKFAATQGNLSPEVSNKELAERTSTPNKPDDGLTSYQGDQDTKAETPLTFSYGEQNRNLPTLDTHQYSVDTEFMSNIGQDETVGDGDTDALNT